jgi:hypothetical protein
MNIELDGFLNEKIDEALNLVNQRNPGLQWSKEQLIKLLIGRGLSHSFRQNVRRKVNLKGIYRRLPPDDIARAMTVTNISRGGIGFVLVDRCRIRPKELLDVDFLLDGEERRTVTRRVLVKHIVADHVGAEFCEFSDEEVLPGLL